MFGERGIEKELGFGDSIQMRILRRIWNSHFNPKTLFGKWKWKWKWKIGFGILIIILQNLAGKMEMKNRIWT